jgi:thiosulfate/3-mercaptopyruvate sulfurtransferase
VYLDLDCALAGPPGTCGRHPLPGLDAFEAAMRAAGVSNARPVVVYDAATAMASARAWWLLRYFGHGEVAVLDGGMAAWSAAGHPLTTDEPHVQPGDFVARRGGMPVIDADEAAALAAHGVLLDARSPERFRGEREPIDPVAGHIPGARNAPATLALDDAGRFRGRSELRRIFERAGVRPDAKVGSYCGSGVTAAHEVLALELAGYRAALYPGSWSEWITDPRRPVARGD